MKLKKNIVYFYTVQKQLQIPIHRYLYKLHSNVIDFFEQKKQEINNYNYANNFNYTLFTSLKKKIRKLHFLLDDIHIFRFVYIDGRCHSIRSFYKVFSLKEMYYLYLPSGKFIEKPIEILHISTGVCFLFNIKNLIILGKGSCVKIIERHKSLNFKKKKTVVKIYMNACSYLDYYKINDTTYLLDQTCILQEDKSECNINTFSFCGESIFYFLSIYQLGKEIHSNINGLSLRQKHINYNTLIEHVFPNGKSSDMYKGLSDSTSNNDFNGKIIVLNTAIKTSANQKSVNILLSNEGKVNANPQLEIFAEDVKCSHGCIIGQLNTQEIFYLRSRGIPKSEVIINLLLSFAKEILNCLSSRKIKNLIKKKIIKNVIHGRNSRIT